MASIIAPSSVETGSTIASTTTVVSSSSPYTKDLSLTTTLKSLHLHHQSEHAAHTDPLATFTSAPSSDDGLDEDQDRPIERTNNTFATAGTVVSLEGTRQQQQQTTSLPLATATSTTAAAVTDVAKNTTPAQKAAAASLDEPAPTPAPAPAYAAPPLVSLTEATLPPKKNDNNSSNSTTSEDKNIPVKINNTEATISTTTETVTVAETSRTPSGSSTIPPASTTVPSISPSPSAAPSNAPSPLLSTSELSAKSAFDQGERFEEESTRSESSYGGNESPRQSLSLSRPLSRQELRRKSSFFNSKDITVSDQRYNKSNTLSSSSSTTFRPINDPRFKSRFQNVLSQWKARANS